MPEGTRTCSKCGRTAPPGDFYPRHRQCKRCANASTKAWRAANKERRAEAYRRNAQIPEVAERRRQRTAAWREANREDIARKHAIWRSENRDKVRGYQSAVPLEVRRRRHKAWRDANKDHLTAYAAAWIAANPEAYKASRFERKSRRRAIAKAATRSRLSVAQIKARMAYFGNKCWICGGPFEHVDHVKPLSKGGPHILANLRPSCASCNLHKGSQWPFSPNRSVADGPHLRRFGDRQAG